MKVSIITISFKNAAGLEKTIKSVRTQTYPDIEHIVIDGGSNDGSKEIIQKYADRIAFWVSEPDKGIYNAMNKGIVQATGDYCLFLNSGDCLFSPTSLEEVMQEGLYADIATANLIYDDNIKAIYCPPDSISCTFMMSTSLPHPSTLINTDLMKRLRYDESYKIISDWAFMFRALVNENCTYQHVNKILTVFYTGGISGTQKETEQKERNDFFYKALPKRLADEITIGQLPFLISVLQMKSFDQSLIRFLIRSIQWIRRVVL